MKVRMYEKFSEFLSEKDIEEFTLSINEIENVLGFKLPMSAYTYREWWSNSESHPLAKEWLLSGYKSKGIKLGESVTLYKNK